MKISIVTPIYNEENNIRRFFNATNNIDYPREDFELVLVNDGSKDNSLKILKEEAQKSDINCSIIDLPENAGWIIARETGAKAAKFENLLFLDCKCEIYPDALLEIKKANYQPICGDSITKPNHLFGRFFYLVRDKLHPKKIDSKTDQIFIGPENFDNVAKGTTMFFCDRSLFLESQIENKTSKYCSDDIKLLKNISNKRKILKSSKIKVHYNARQSFKENYKHLISRGPRFIDYYYKPGKKYFWVINFFFISIFALIYLIIVKKLLLETFLFSIIANSLISLYLAKKIKDFFIVFTLLPTMSAIFLVAIYRGIFLKLIRKY